MHFLCIYFYSKAKVSERRRDRVRGIFHPLLLSWIDHKGWTWADLKPELRASSKFLTWVQSPRTWAILCSWGHDQGADLKVEQPGCRWVTIWADRRLAYNAIAPIIIPQMCILQALPPFRAICSISMDNQRTCELGLTSHSLDARISSEMPTGANPGPWARSEGKSCSVRASGIGGFPEKQCSTKNGDSKPWRLWVPPHSLAWSFPQGLFSCNTLHAVCYGSNNPSFVFLTSMKAPLSPSLNRDPPSSYHVLCVRGSAGKQDLELVISLVSQDWCSLKYKVT